MSVAWNKGDRKWTEESLRNAIQSVNNFRDLLRKFDLSDGTRTRKYVKEDIARFGIDIAHFKTNSRRWSDDDLREAVKDSK